LSFAHAFASFNQPLERLQEMCVRFSTRALVSVAVTLLLVIGGVLLMLGFNGAFIG
jgi:hypothetical protein